MLVPHSSPGMPGVSSARSDRAIRERAVCAAAQPDGDGAAVENQRRVELASPGEAENLVFDVA